MYNILANNWLRPCSGCQLYIVHTVYRLKDELMQLAICKY